MEIKPINISETSALYLLQPEGWVDIVPVFDFYCRASFCYPVKVTLDREIIGVGCAIIHSDVAWLGHIIVDQGYRRQGIGQQIVQALLEIARENHCTTMYLIATELGEPVYKKAGFITEAEYLVYKDIEGCDWSISDHIYPYKDKYRKHISVLDREVSGEDRMVHLEEHLMDSLAFLNENVVEGYYMPTLGEGLIIAGTESAGIELMKMRLKQTNRIVFPRDNLTAQSFLQNMGVGDMKIINRMRLGEKRKVQFAGIYSRIAGNVG